MASRWRSAFISLVFLIVGVIGLSLLIVSATLEAWQILYLGSYSFEGMYLYSLLSLTGFELSGYFLASCLRRRTPDSPEVDELDKEVEEDVFQLDPQ